VAVEIYCILQGLRVSHTPKTKSHPDDVIGSERRWSVGAPGALILSWDLGTLPTTHNEGGLGSAKFMTPMVGVCGADYNGMRWA
jgi:hypothetical protein